MRKPWWLSRGRRAEVRAVKYVIDVIWNDIDAVNLHIGVYPFGTVRRNEAILKWCDLMDELDNYKKKLKEVKRNGLR